MKSFNALVGQTTQSAMREDRQIKQLISRIVPTTSLAHIEFCRSEGGRLRITVDGAAWISKMRFLESQIIGVMRAQGHDCHTVSYHVAPAEKPVARKTVRQARKASAGAANVEAAARAVTGPTDDRLRQELLKLARSLRAE